MALSTRHSKLLISSLRHYWPTHVMVVAGVAVAVAVLAGALLVGASVRTSLRELATSRLGATDLLLSGPALFSESLGERLAQDSSFAADFDGVTPVLMLEGAATHETSGRTAARVQVFGVDERFARFHGLNWPALRGRQALISAQLATELGAEVGDSVVARVAKPTDIPFSTLQGRRDEAGERLRVDVARILDQSSLGHFSLTPSQGPVLSMFVALDRLQQDLEVGERVNGLLIREHEPSRRDSDDALAPLRETVQKSVELEDLGLRLRRGGDGTTVLLESRTGLLPAPVAQRAGEVAASLGARSTRVLTYLANSLRIGDREVPYSLVAATDLKDLGETALPQLPSRVGSRDSSRGDGQSASPSAEVPPIKLNAWAADDLRASPGDQVRLTYFLWSDETALTTHETSFRFDGVVPMQGLGSDATLTPEYPGMTDAADVTAWDPPFPVDLSRVRPEDEAYWDEFRSAPKAFIALDVGQDLWPSPFGSISSLRMAPDDGDVNGFAARLSAALRANLDPFESGLSARHVRAEAIAAAEGTTDFGEYFLYFSFFLVCSALLLTYLFFALSLEQRTREVGILASLGFSPRALRALYLSEGALLAGTGTLVGIAGALGYAALILYGLRTWWVGAVGTTALQLHIDPLYLVPGTAMAFAAALGALWLGSRRMLRRSARDLLSGVVVSGVGVPASSRPRLLSRVALLLVLIGAGLLVAARVGVLGAVAAFFGAGACGLLAGLFAVGALLWRGSAGGSLLGHRRARMARLGIRQAAWRPARSVMSLALIAFACFVLVTVGAFRRDPAGASLDRQSGTGGFVLLGESVAPLLHDPNTEAGRDELALPPDPLFEDLHVARFRLKPGDDGSCLTLYRPTNPRIVAPEEAFLTEGRFRFSASLADSSEERANPWLLLHRRFEDGAVPAIADQTSLAYVYHLGVGEDFVLPSTGGAPPVRLRMVAALADSVLQSEVIVADREFVRLFPYHEGYRFWMIEAPADRADAIATWLEGRLSDFGLDLVDTRARLAAYHEVENTYLSTFQALGGLGLLIGTLGLAAVLARNVLERQRELGVLGAIGFKPAQLRSIVMAESGALVVGGVLLGTAAALLAVWPAMSERAQSFPVGSLVGLLGAVAITGLGSALVATRLVTGMSITQAVKGE